MKVDFGYCCISVIHEKLRCNRSSTKTYLEKMEEGKAREYLIKKANENLLEAARLLSENAKADIKAYRLPEQILPQIDLGYYGIEDVRDNLLLVGKTANHLDIQLSNHPSQYFVLNSKNPEVVRKTITSLNLFAETLHAMELQHVPNLILHVGVKNGYEHPMEAMDAFCENFERLDNAAKRFLVIENDHVSFTVEDCLNIHQKIGIPVVFDNMHYQWNPGNLSFDDAVKGAVDTWGKRTPKFHLASDKGKNKHAHSDFIEREDYEKLRRAAEATNIKHCYMMLECKQKDAAILELRKEISKMSS